MSRPKLSFEIFLISLAVILLEVGYTRVFSYKLVYYFTYVIIGISLLGLGAGAILVAMFPRLRQAQPERSIPLCGLAGGLAVLIGYWTVAEVQLNAYDLARVLGASFSPVLLREGAKLALLSVVLFLPFMLAGIVVSTVLSTRSEQVHRLYFADLMGAALGCALCVPLMVLITPPGTVVLGGCLMAAVGLKTTMRSASPLRLPVAFVSLALLGFAVVPGWLPDPVTDRLKTMSPDRNQQVLFSAWSPVFRVDVVKAFAAAGGHMIVHDGMWGSLLAAYDGDPASFDHFDHDSRSVPFQMLRPEPSVAIIGAAGGHELQASTHFGASKITGVELNPVTVSLLTEHFADFTGRIAFAENVELVNAEGRSFLSSQEQLFDLIWFVAPDSYAAMNAATSGAFVLSESYLYTVEMIKLSLEHLTRGGIICAQFGERDMRTPARSIRYLSTARAAFEELGIEDFSRHVLVGSDPGFAFRNAIIVLRLDPFSKVEAQRFAKAVNALKDGVVHWRWDRPISKHPFRAVIALPTDELERWYEAYRYDVRPVTDDSPFFWHFVSFAEAISTPPKSDEDMEFGIGERLLLMLLASVTLLGACFLLAPLLLRRALWKTIPHKGRAALYFGSIGLGFMFLEVSLIQRLTLLLGYPTYSLTVTLFSLLVATGLGSLVSESFTLSRRLLLIRLLAVLVGLVIFFWFGLTPLVEVAIAWALPLRIALAIAVLAPLGLCLGMFMPLGLSVVAATTSHSEEYVAWAWAINGFSSVVASVLTTILSMTFGFSAVMGIALGVYGLAALALSSIPSEARAS